MRVLGFMTGTSLDAVDMAVLETDGETLQAFGPVGERKLGTETRDLVEAAIVAGRSWPWGAPEPAAFAVAARAVADAHLEAARAFLAQARLSAADLDLVGVHGQTVLHEPPTATRAQGRTVQLVDAQRIADGLRLPVAHDFRVADVAAGGQGAPLAPVYHAALARWSGLEAPFAILNIGGVANITLVRRDGTMDAFDTGPGNGMIDLMLQARGLGRFDADGARARAGLIDNAALSAYLAHPYLQAPPPKSLDRYDFSLDPVDGLSAEDAAATLTAFAVTAVALSTAWLDREDRPGVIVVAGGGRHNPAIMEGLRASLAPTRILSAEEAGWRGDAVEAEAFAYLAARCALGLPISFPRTTGVPAPLTGGRIVRPR